MEIMQTRSSFNKLNNFLELRQIPLIIKSAIEVNFFEILDKGNKTLIEIVNKAKTDELISKYLLEVLVCIDLVVKKDDYYSLSLDAKEFLCENSPNNQIFRFKGLEDNLSMYKNLTAKLKNEEINQDSKKKWSSKEIMQLMRQSSKTGGIQDIYNFTSTISNFSKMEKMADLGGNSGYYSLAFLAVNKNLKAHIFDTKEVCKEAEIFNKDDENKDRLFFHSQDLDENFDFGKDYDLVFASHFLYGKNINNKLEETFKLINKSLKMGGVFISNHYGDNLAKEAQIYLALINLRSSLFGLKSHQINKDRLENALRKAGFGNFRLCRNYTNNEGLHTMISIAEKISEI